MRLVLDTNVVLDWLVFDDPSVRALARGIEAGGVEVVTSAECTAELRRVLAYPQFELDATAQGAAMDRYTTHTRVMEQGEAPSRLPRCTDPDDQKFLELAWHASADALVTKDKALLRLRRRVERMRIVRPADLDP